jgi:ParB-like chromosome segregation protein Spo0J
MLVLDTAAWEELELSVLTDIHLDPKNVRLETADAAIEADIIEDLFANENALELVEAISKIGYLTHEIPVVVKRRGKYVVVEGNRRLAALKAIQNPMIVPTHQARISAFTKNIPSIEALAKIRVMVAPNQELANQLIAAIHTSNMRVRWTPERQAVFFQAQIDAGRTYAQLVERYPTINVAIFVFRAHIVNALRGIQYDDPELGKFFSTKQWRKSTSTLTRIYQSKDFLDLTGFVMDDKGVVGKTISLRFED